MMSNQTGDQMNEGRSGRYVSTPGQDTMRREMEAAASRIGEPAKLGMIMDDVFGKLAPDEDVRFEALKIIHEAPDLVLSMQQWQVVQGMVERAWREGYLSASPRPR